MKTIITILFITILTPVSVLAATNPVPWNNVTEFLQAALDVMVQIGSMVLVIMIIYSGYLFVTAQGSVENIKKAKHTFTWAILGGALLLGAWALSLGITDTINAL